jgi:hypothetical protein
MSYRTLHSSLGCSAFGAGALFVLYGCGSAPAFDPSPQAAKVAGAKTVQAGNAARKSAIKNRANVQDASASFTSLQIVGLDEAQLRDVMGVPASADDSAPGKVWRYHKGGCTLSIALYPDVKTRVFHALTYEVTSNEHGTGTDRLCRTQFASASPGKLPASR